MKSRTRWVIVTVSLILAAVATWLYRTSGVSASVVEKELLTVQQVDFPLIVSASGVLEAARSVSIGPPRVGREHRFKLSRLVEEGKEVFEGDFLVEFDGSDIDRRLRDETANFQKVQQEYQKKRSDFDMQVRDLDYQLEQAKADYEKIKNKLEGQAELQSAMTVAEQEIRRDTAKLKAELLEKKLGLLKEQGRIDLQISLSNERAYKKRMEDLLDARDALVVTAPVSGVVIYKRGWDGEARQVGSNVFMMDTIIELPDLKTIRAKVMVDEVDINKIRAGQTAQVQVAAVKGKVFAAKIEGVAAILKQASFDRPQKIADVLLSIQDNDEADLKLLRPGMSVVCSIQVGSYDKAIVVPLSSVLERNGHSMVQVWNELNKTWAWRNVELATNDGLSAVISSGLQPNEKIRIKPKA
jgi:HlyD family secretion protein